MFMLFDSPFCPPLESRPLLSQTAITGGIQGSVLDEKGGLVPAASVVLTNAGLALTQKAVTDSAGTFRFYRLPPSGEYRVTVAADNFSLWARDAVAVPSGESATVTANLSVGVKRETVEVSAAPPVIAVDSTEVSQTVDRRASQGPEAAPGTH